ncbi:PH domain-containing protein [Stutzerimonas stutzeri]|uniref:PH domain-containing protein n=1 Tax=Stutzerimonas stutzeri TaxID=316 RepID=UPI00265D56B5|nr:PH domain-containing protein [Stutzerimonas stutzeri]MCF6783703.1 PH domain-containing protein [Stutzerimonas stutzeri]
MAAYVDKVLARGEKVIYQGGVSGWSLMSEFIFGLVTLPFFGFGALIWAGALIRYFTTELAITNKRVIAKFGLISRSTIEINLHRIESVQVIQSVIGRILNYGTIVVSGAGNPQAPIPGIASPLEFRRMFVEAQEGTGQADGIGLSV